MSDVLPPSPLSVPALDVGTGADLAWLLATGKVRGAGRDQPVTMTTGVAGTVSGSLVPVTFPTAGGGGFTVSLPWINEPPAPADNVLVAHIGQARVVLGPYLKPEDVDDDSAYALATDLSTLASRVTTLESDEANDMFVEGGGVQAFGWTGGVVNKTADGSGNCSVSFGEPGTPFSYANTVVTAWCQGASGGAPIAVNIGAVNLGSLDLHLSGLEGTVVPGNSFDLIYGILGY